MDLPLEWMELEGLAPPLATKALTGVFMASMGAGKYRTRLAF